MCGRFVQASPGDVVQAEFGLEAAPDLTPCYNVAPTMQVAAVRLEAGGDAPRLVRLHWGLIPFWADRRSIGPRLINARSETAHDKPAFRDAFTRRRCLIPADGFYEWTKARSGQKQPYLIRLRSRRPLAMAGLWERWRDPQGERVESVTVLTTRANDLVAELHDRMPVLLDATARLLWIDPAETDLERLRALMKPFESRSLEAYRVSRRVNKVANDDPSLIEPAADEPDEPDEPGRNDGQLDLF